MDADSSLCWRLKYLALQRWLRLAFFCDCWLGCECSVGFLCSWDDAWGEVWREVGGASWRVVLIGISPSVWGVGALSDPIRLFPLCRNRAAPPLLIQRRSSAVATLFLTQFVVIVLLGAHVQVGLVCQELQWWIHPPVSYAYSSFSPFYHPLRLQ